MDEDYGAQEFYEPPDYEVWETNRVYEDMAIERAEYEAEMKAEVIEAEVREVVERVAAALPTMPLDIIERIAERIIEYQWEKREADDPNNPAHPRFFGGPDVGYSDEEGEAYVS